MNRRYRLKPALQRRPDGRPRSIPVEGLIFTGGDVVVTPMNMSQWVGVLLVEVKDKSVKSKPVAVETPSPPIPDPLSIPFPLDSPTESDPPPVITTEGANLSFSSGEESAPKVTRKRRSRKRS